MKLHVTGDIEDIAQAAWISTKDEIDAKARTHEDAVRVVRFLIDNHHTSPLECVTLTFSQMSPSEFNNFDDIIPFYLSSFVKRSYNVFTMDLLTFVKIIHFSSTDSGLWDEAAEMFRVARPELSVLLENFAHPQQETEKVDASSCNEIGMDVQLISFHEVKNSRDQSRATWRVKCPLSIAVQILRHRKGSYNMVSGRYRTITQETVGIPIDISEIEIRFNDAAYDLDIDMWIPDRDICYSIGAEEQNKYYDDWMAVAKEAKKHEIISNDEYKRFREFIRFCLPEGRLTELYVTYYLDDFYNNYLPLRNSKHAQLEHVWVAQKMQETLETRLRESV